MLKKLGVIAIRIGKATYIRKETVWATSVKNDVCLLNVNKLPGHSLVNLFVLILTPAGITGTQCLTYPCVNKIKLVYIRSTNVIGLCLWTLPFL